MVPSCTERCFVQSFFNGGFSRESLAAKRKRDASELKVDDPSRGTVEVDIRVEGKIQHFRSRHKRLFIRLLGNNHMYISI